MLKQSLSRRSEAESVLSAGLDVMNKKKLRYAFNAVIELAENARCEQLHHTKKQQHGLGEMCKAEYHLQRQAHIVREYIKNNDI